MKGRESRVASLVGYPYMMAPGAAGLVDLVSLDKAEGKKMRGIPCSNDVFI